MPDDPIPIPTGPRFEPDPANRRLRLDPWPLIRSAAHDLGGRILTVDEIVSPDETRRLTWTYFRGRHAVLILPLDEDDNVILVREYRHPLGREVYNIPAGGAGHCVTEADLLVQAEKELAEEAGIMAREWRKLGQYYPVPSMTSVLFHLYLARGLEPIPERGTGPEWFEVEEVVKVPFANLYRAALAGELEDGSSLMAVLLAAAQGVTTLESRSMPGKESPLDES